MHPLRRARSLTLRQRVRALLVAMVVLIALLVVVGAVAVRSLEGANTRLTAELLPALVDVERLQGLYLDQQTSARGYVLTGDPAFLEPYATAEAQIGPVEDHLRAVLADNPDSLAKLDAVEQSHAEWVAAVTPVLVLVDQGRVAEAQQQVQASSGQVFAALRADVDALRGDVQATAGESAARVERVRDAARWAAGTIAVIALLLAGATLVGLRRSVSRPLRDLVSSVSAAADGARAQQARVSGPPEFLTIGSAVERMRLDLSRHMDEAVATQRRLTAAEESERIANELQDAVIQRLFGVGLTVTSLANRRPEVRDALLEVVEELDRAIRELRSVVFGLSSGTAPRAVPAGSDTERGAAP